MYDAPGARIEKTAVRALTNGQPCVVQNISGWAAKTQPIGRYVDPSGGTADDIAVGEEFVIFVGGVHELALTGALAGLAAGQRLWIDPADDSVETTAGAAASGFIPLGVILQVDTARDPDVARVLHFGAGAAFHPTP